MEVNWYKIYPSIYIGLVNRVPDASLRGDLLLVIMHCLNENGLTDDSEEISFTTGLSLERIEQLRPWLNRISTSESGTLMVKVVEETIREREQFGANKADAGRKGGLKRQTAPKKAQVIPIKQDTSTSKQDEAPSSTEPMAMAAGSTAKHGLSTAKAQLSTAQAVLSHTDIQTDIQTIESSDPKGVYAHAGEPPFSSLNGKTEFQDTISDAIVEIMPGLEADYTAQMQICQLVLREKASADDVRRWANWLCTRYPGAIKNQFKFRDTFSDMLRETAEKTAGYWFVFYACGHKDGARLSAKADQEIKREADWLDSQVGDTEKVTWKARGLLPQHFRKYWNDSLKYPGFPSPEKVRTYWTQFTEWVVKQNGSLR